MRKTNNDCVSTWKMEEFSAMQIERMRANKEIIIPKYQRGIVWKESQKRDLIDSIKKGIPFGSILLYHDRENNNYRLIDGLQRCETITEFINNPADYFNENDIPDEALDELIEIIGINNQKEKIREEVIETILKWIKEDNKNMDDIVQMQYYSCAEALRKKFATLDGKQNDVINTITPFFATFKQICGQLKDSKIPSIVIEGSEDNLPLIFERINSKGAQLTKWQIFAATWSEDKVKLEKYFEDIIKYNLERYEKMYDDNEGMALEEVDYSSMKKDMTVNYFELFFGFGKILVNKYPNLFGTDKKATEVHSIGFNLINACLISNSADIKNLNTNIQTIVGNDKNINLFLQKILECTETVDKVLACAGGFKSNSRKDNAPLHTEMQICSIIASVFINKYGIIEFDDDENIVSKAIDLTEPNKDYKKWEKQFKDNCLKMYVTDIVQSSWKGSGDKKLDNIIKNLDHYIKPVDEKTFRSVINIWYENIKNERNEITKVQSPKEADKVIMNIIYSNSFSAKDQIDDSKYDIEHLATKEIMKNRLQKYNNLKLPISSIGNLCLLNEKFNRSKGEKTIYQNGLSKNDLQIIEEKYSFTTKEDMDFLLDEKLSKDQFRDAYIKFIDKRYEIIINKLVELIY